MDDDQGAGTGELNNHQKADPAKVADLLGILLWPVSDCTSFTKFVKLALVHGGRTIEIYDRDLLYITRGPRGGA
jgi:hypothetical protein